MRCYRKQLLPSLTGLARFSADTRHSRAGLMDSAAFGGCPLAVHCFLAHSRERYFLNKFSKAWRASMGRACTGVDVSFSTRTLME
jgi:hypothetical protein